MGDFSAAWLALREPADHRARSARLAQAVANRLLDASPVRVVDLASGTGSNLRYLARYLRGSQHWRLVDHDAALLAQVEAPTAPSRIASIHVQPYDLSRLEAAGDLFDHASLVTASALLDLVSDRWLGALADRCVEVKATSLFALSYDGRIVFTPDDPDDDTVRGLVNRHQRTDKGFGVALGPDAADAAERCFSARGCAVERERSDWILGARDAELQRQLIDGWAAAAAEIASARAPAIGWWRVRRREHVDAGHSTILVGHEDLAAWIR
jgi:SAM-dependent methyltransferase